MKEVYGHESRGRPIEENRERYNVILLRYALDDDGKCVNLSSSTRGYPTMAAAEEMSLLYIELGKYTEVNVYDDLIQKRNNEIRV